METIKNYLASMFANLPDTPEVRRAHDELWQMMEDKYNELIEEGETENTAIGTVIAEFGNLDELADDLGLRSEVNRDRQNQAEHPTRTLTLDEVKEYFKSVSDNANRIALGVFFCIVCAIGPIIPAALGKTSGMGLKLGVVILFVLLAMAIACFIFSGLELSKWKFIWRDNCIIDMTTAAFVEDERARYRSSYAMKLTIGIILCVLCWVPSIVMAGGKAGNLDLSILSAVTVLILVGLGVYLLVQNGQIKAGYLRLIRLNSRDTMAGRYVDDDGVEYKTEKGKTIMELYWPTVVCIYLVLSFLTFEWGTTWIIWPIAGVLCGVLKRRLAK